MNANNKTAHIGESHDCLFKQSSQHYFFFFQDVNNSFTYVSSGVTPLLGYSQKEMLNLQEYLLTEESSNSKAVEHRIHALQGKSQPDYEIEVYKKDHSTCRLEINELPVFNEYGNVVAIEGIAIEINPNVTVENTSFDQSQKNHTLQDALDAADAGTFSYDVLLDKTWWDKKSHEIFSVDTKTFQNNYDSWRRLVVKEDLPAVEKKFKRILSSSLTHFELDYRVYSNEPSRWVRVKAQITRNRQGKAIFINGLHLDVTKTKLLENKLLQSESRYRSLVENSPDWIWETDTQGCYTYSSPYIKKLLGYEPEEVLGKTICSLIDEDESIRFIDLFQACMKKQLPFSDIESINLHKNGKKIVLETNASPMFDIADKFIGYRGIHRNITDRIATKKLILDKEISDLANQSKSEFLANMSHELRTPMHAILSFSHLGIKKINSSSIEKLLAYFEKINQSGERLLSLLNDLLDLSKLEAGKLEFNFVNHDLKSVLKQCIGEQEAQLKLKQLSVNIIEPDCSTEAQFDVVKIAQIITNFFSNAIKFSEQGTTLTVAISIDELFSDEGIFAGLRFSLRDQGVGIPENELEHIFDKFVQSSKTKNNAGGTGLGLSICKEFIDAHHGRIWAEQNPDRGSIFNFVIPLQQPDLQ